MITAFLFYGKIVSSKGQIDWKALYINRFLRLTPIYWAVLACVVGVILAKSHFRLMVDPQDFFNPLLEWCLFTLQDNPTINGYEQTNYVTAGVVWTLRYECLFYMTLPLLSVIGRFRILSYRLAFLVGLFLLWGVMRNNALFTNIGFIKPFGIRMLLPFILGMAVLELSNVSVFYQFARSYSGSIAYAILILGSLAMPGDPYSGPRMICIFAAFALIAAGTDVFGTLQRPESKLLGDISFSIYLIHGIFLHLLFQVVNEMGFANYRTVWLMMPAAMAIFIFLSKISYSFIETPFISLGKRLLPRRKPIEKMAEIAP